MLLQPSYNRKTYTTIKQY